MNAYVAPTDYGWFEFLSSRPDVDEVNFWMPKPSGGQFGVLRRWEPLLFKLKAPHNVIAGGGFFEHYTELPISLAWDAFGEKNGACSLSEVRNSVARLGPVSARDVGLPDPAARHVGGKPGPEQNRPG